jgi:hypothetical protein
VSLIKNSKTTPAASIAGRIPPSAGCDGAIRCAGLKILDALDGLRPPLLGRLLNLKCSECGGKRITTRPARHRRATTGARSGRRYDLKRLRVKTSLAAALFPVCGDCRMRSRQGLP